jgi:hypothetical protein
MKKTLHLSCLMVLLLTIGCGKPANNDHDHSHDPLEAEGNEALYNEVMKVHDEVMPKMNDIYKLKEQLKNKIAENPTMTESQRKDIEETIANLDAASDGMMVWMRQFNPIPDSEGEEKAREYLENEMEKIKKVREDMLESIAKAKEKIN